MIWRAFSGEFSQFSDSRGREDGYCRLGGRKHRPGLNVCAVMSALLTIYRLTARLKAHVGGVEVDRVTRAPEPSARAAQHAAFT